MLLMDNIRDKFDQSQPLKIIALGLNGKKRVVADLWPMLMDRPYIVVPGSGSDSAQTICPIPAPRDRQRRRSTCPVGYAPSPPWSRWPTLSRDID